MTHRFVGRPRGAVLAAVIVCLTVVMLLGAATVQSMVLRQRQARLDQRRLQAFWLAESAMGRALAELKADPTYEGGAWRVSLNGGEPVLTAVAQIRVESPVDAPRMRRIVVVASWPDDPIQRSVHQLEQLTLLAEPGD